MPQTDAEGYHVHLDETWGHMTKLWYLTGCDDNVLVTSN